MTIWGLHGILRVVVDTMLIGFSMWLVDHILTWLSSDFIWAHWAQWARFRRQARICILTSPYQEFHRDPEIQYLILNMNIHMPGLKYQMLSKNARK